MNAFDARQNLIELHAVVWGRVQGVGFRVSTRRFAIQLGLKGSVTNLEDGNVEIYAQGTRDQLETFLNLLKEHFKSGYIARIDTKFEKPVKIFEGFEIL